MRIGVASSGEAIEAMEAMEVCLKWEGDVMKNSLVGSPMSRGERRSLKAAARRMQSR